MKRIIQGLALAALISTAQASQASAFPPDGEPTSVPVAWTYADRHAGGPDLRVGSSFPPNGEETSVPVASTYADRHAGESGQIIGSAFPPDGEPKSVPVAWTRADRYARAFDQRAALSD